MPAHCRPLPRRVLVPDRDHGFRARRNGRAYRGHVKVHFFADGNPDRLDGGIHIIPFGILIVHQHIERVGLLLGIACDHHPELAGNHRADREIPDIDASFRGRDRAVVILLDPDCRIPALFIPDILNRYIDVSFVSRVQVLGVNVGNRDLHFGFYLDRECDALVYRLVLVIQGVGAFLLGLVQVRVIQNDRNLVGPCRGVLVDLDMEGRGGGGACQEITDYLGVGLDDDRGIGRPEGNGQPVLPCWRDRLDRLSRTG